MPQIQSVSFQVPQSPYDTSLGAQLNQFFISNPEITLLASTLTSRAVLTPRSLPVLVLFFYTGVQATFTLPGGISYKAYEFIGPQAEQEANALLISDPSLQIWAYLNLRPVETRFTNIKKVILIVYKDDQCRQRKKKITYCTVYNNAAAIPFWGSGAVVFPDLPCPTANVLNLNTTTWAVRTPSFGIQAVNQLGQTALVTLGPSAAPGPVLPSAPPIPPQPLKEPCPCCFRLSAFAIQRGIADCAHTYHLIPDFKTCYKGDPIAIIKALITGWIMTPGNCYCNPPNHKLVFPNPAHYQIVVSAVFDQGYLAVICVEDLVQPCTDQDYNDIFIYVALERCEGDCLPVPPVANIQPVI